MSIPVANTRVTVTRVTQPEDGYADPIESVVYRNVRAVIAEPGGSRSFTPGGSLVDIARTMTSDVMKLREGDKVTDHADSTVYEVAWSGLHAGPYRHTTTGLKWTEYSA